MKDTQYIIFNRNKRPSDWDAYRIPQGFESEAEAVCASYSDALVVDAIPERRKRDARVHDEAREYHHIAAVLRECQT